MGGWTQLHQNLARPLGDHRSIAVLFPWISTRIYQTQADITIHVCVGETDIAAMQMLYYIFFLPFFIYSTYPPKFAFASSLETSAMELMLYNGVEWFQFAVNYGGG